MYSSFEQFVKEIKEHECDNKTFIPLNEEENIFIFLCNCGKEIKINVETLSEKDKNKFSKFYAESLSLISV